MVEMTPPPLRRTITGQQLTVGMKTRRMRIRMSSRSQRRSVPATPTQRTTSTMTIHLQVVGGLDRIEGASEERAPGLRARGLAMGPALYHQDRARLREITLY